MMKIKRAIIGHIINIPTQKLVNNIFWSTFSITFIIWIMVLYTNYKVLPVVILGLVFYTITAWIACFPSSVKNRFGKMQAKLADNYYHEQY